MWRFSCFFNRPVTKGTGHRAVHRGRLRPAVLLHPGDPRSRQRHPHRQHEPRRVPDDCRCRSSLDQPGNGKWRRRRHRWRRRLVVHIHLSCHRLFCAITWTKRNSGCASFLKDENFFLDCFCSVDLGSELSGLRSRYGP